MADKIVQLVDEDNNNIYPISRGIAADSVDTAALKNNSVTEDKLTSDSKYVAGQSLSIVHGEKIPSSYQRVSYIQNTTNAHFVINGFSLTGADTVTADIRVESSSSSWATLWCSRVAGTTDTSTVFCNTTDGTTIRSDYNTTQSTISWGYLGERHTFRLYQGDFSIDGWRQVARAESTFTSPTQTTLMCSNMNGSTYDNYCYGRIYLFRVERGGETVLNLVPCYRKSDSRVGLYDTISDTFYTYTGTGDYTTGAAIDAESNIIAVTQVGNGQYRAASISADKMSTACKSEMKGFWHSTPTDTKTKIKVTIPKSAYVRRMFMVLECGNSNTSRRAFLLSFNTNANGDLTPTYCVATALTGTAPTLTVDATANTITFPSLGAWGEVTIEFFDYYQAGFELAA